MKYLSHYTEKEQTKLLKECGAFFAFTDATYNEKKQDNIKYSFLNSGLVVPTENVDILLNGLKNIQSKGIEQDIKENGRIKIIWRELSNHEAQLTCSIDDTMEALSGYGITRKEVSAEYIKFFDHCIDNNLF